MPGYYGHRRLESGGDGGSLAPPGSYSMTTRYAISLLGIVVDVQELPTGQLPVLLLGQVATASATLKVGDLVILGL